MSLNKILTLSQELRKNGFDKQADELEYKFIVLNKFKTINKTASMSKNQLVEVMVEYFKDKTRYSPEALKSMCSSLSYDQLNNFNEKLMLHEFASGAAPRLSDYFGSGAARGAAHVGGTSASPSPSLPTPHGSSHSSPHTSPGMRSDGTFIVTDLDSAEKAIKHMEADPSAISKYIKLPETEKTLITTAYKDASWMNRRLVGLPGTASRTRAKWLAWSTTGAAALGLLGLGLMGDDDKVPQVSPDAPNKPEPEASAKPKPGSKSPSVPAAPKAPSTRGARPGVTPRPSTTANVDETDIQ